MGRCDHCGNDYDKTFDVKRGGETRTFDSFECAIHVMAPTCGQCGVRIIGHGVESSSEFYCCANCAEKAGVDGLVDRVGGGR